MKKFIYVLLIIFIIISLTSCDPPFYYNGEEEYMYLWGVAASNLPGAYSSNGEGIAESIQTDSYGRVLFKYKEGTWLTEFEVDTYAYFICQKHDDINSYYYENICYIMADSWEFFSEAEINKLKKMNDWELPLEKEKMLSCSIPNSYTKKPYKVSYNKKTVVKAFKELTGNNEIDDRRICCLCNDSEGKVLVFIRDIEYIEENQYRYGNSYIIIIDKDGSYSKDSIIQLDNFYNHRDQLIDLKELNGWNR